MLVVRDSELAALADPGEDQYFLTDPKKLQLICDAIDIRPTDDVVELGAGAGTVARVLPRARSLDLVELDPRLIPALTSNAPGYATIHNADGVALLRDGRLCADVILGNLPHRVTTELAALLPRLRFRVAVLAAASMEPFDTLGDGLSYSVLTTIAGNDFTPPQPSTSLLVRVQHRTDHPDHHSSR